MPYYYWTGVDIHAHTKSGYLVGLSVNDVDQRLFLQGIALLSIKKTFSLRSKKYSLQDQLQIFDHIARLQKAGILLPHAIELVATGISNPHLQEILHRICMDVKSGNTFGKAMSKYPQLCSPLIGQILSAGQKTGNLTNACMHIARHIRTKQKIYKDIRRALTMPAITLAAFCTILITMIMVVVPRFADMVSNFNTSIPQTTTWLLWLSTSLTMQSVSISLFGTAAALMIIKRYNNSKIVKKIKDVSMLRVPLIRSIVLDIHVGYTLHSLSALIASGTTLPDAGTVIIHTCHNSTLKKSWQAVFEAVQAGESLFIAIKRHPYIPRVHDLSAQLAVAQNTGSIARVCALCSKQYLTHAKASLTRLITYIQPMSIVVLGFCVVALMISLYAPIMNLSFSP